MSLHSEQGELEQAGTQLWVLQLEALLDTHTKGDVPNSRYCMPGSDMYLRSLDSYPVI